MKKIKKFFFIFVLVIVVYFFFKKIFPSRENSALLRYDLNEGDQYSMNVTLEDPYYDVVDIDFLFSVHSVDNDNFILNMSFSSINIVEIDSVNFDSFTDSILGDNCFSYNINSSGKLENFIIDQACQNKSILYRIYDIFTSKEYFHQYPLNNFIDNPIIMPNFPKGVIEIGDSFTNTSYNNTMGSGFNDLKTETKYVLKEITDSEYIFDFYQEHYSGAKTVMYDKEIITKTTGKSVFFKSSGWFSNGQYDVSYYTVDGEAIIDFSNPGKSFSIFTSKL